MAVAGLVPAANHAAVVLSVDSGFTPFSVAYPGAASDLRNVNFPTVGTFFRLGWQQYSSYASNVIQRVGSFQQNIVVSGNDPVKLATGVTISAGANWYAGFMDASSTAHDIGGGQWGGTGVQQGYIGFKFTPAATTFYGWFDVSFDNNLSTMTLNGWAYENTGAPIMTGVPEPTDTALVMGLLSLAAGAAGIRRRRAASAKA